ncbi:MAG TPA: hypothetical protein PKY59_16125 [Pyrinomonadaceae bacterium]|nr:hypothetical protein [Pyrinomonadaceae bacterium]
MSELKSEQQSKFGVFSFFIGIFNLVYPVLLFTDLNGDGANILKPLVDLMPDKGGSGETGTGLILIFVFYLLVPVCGHLIGIISGLLGSFQKENKRTMAVVGLILNLLLPILAVCGYIYLVFLHEYSQYR